ncbi:MAG: HAD family acid phosphatase [Candidatus Acidiferrales bacterium]
MIRFAACLAALGALFALVAARPAAPTCPTYENLNATLWMQTAVEYKASTLETYHVAEAALVRGLADRHSTAALEQTGNFENLPPAVVLDLDETVLDNSPFEARLVASGSPWSRDAWLAWVKEENATLIPGAIDFLDFARDKHVAPIYITNRACDPTNDDDPTVQQLRKLKLPLATGADWLLCEQPGAGPDKTSRRAEVALHYRILLMFGDQLGDFLGIPKASASLAGREKLFEDHQAMWGDRWFQLPNPTYGSWEAAMGYTVAEKLPYLRQ